MVSFPTSIAIGICKHACLTTLSLNYWRYHLRPCAAENFLLPFSSPPPSLASFWPPRAFAETPRLPYAYVPPLHQWALSRSCHYQSCCCVNVPFRQTYLMKLLRSRGKKELMRSKNSQFHNQATTDSPVTEPLRTHSSKKNSLKCVLWRSSVERCFGGGRKSLLHPLGTYSRLRSQGVAWMSPITCLILHYRASCASTAMYPPMHPPIR
jgi:hypothetical protein